MRKIILALILVLALLSGINPNVTGQDHEHDDDDHGGCHFFYGMIDHEPVSR